MEERRKISLVKREQDKYNPTTNLSTQKALTIVGAFCAYHEQANNLPNRVVLPFTEDNSSLRNMLHILSGKVKLEISTGIIEKHTSGDPLQISNSEGW
jgi:hypothetical protein